MSTESPMPRPLGRDRLEPSEDGTVILLSRGARPWSAREEAAPGRARRAGTAVSWDGGLFEVLRAEKREAGGYRYVLSPWDDREVVRSVVDYTEERAAPEPSRAPAGGDLPSRWNALPASVRALVAGFVPAVLLGWFFPFRVMGEGFSFLVHELGHTLVAWFFGCSALPAIVLTIAFEQNRAVAALIWGALLYAAFRARKTPRWNAALAAAAALYPLVAFTGAHLVAFHLGGHLAEAGVAAWALDRALDDERPEWERPVWSFFAFYLVARNVKLFLGVAFSAAARTEYRTVAIAGENDLVKAASATGLTLEALAVMTAVLFLAVPAAVLVPAFRRGAR